MRNRREYNAFRQCGYMREGNAHKVENTVNSGVLLSTQGQTTQMCDVANHGSAMTQSAP
jgi:hypothetical protein